MSSHDDQDNWLQQSDEIEVLKAIYDGSLVADEKDQTKFSVTLSEGSGVFQQSLTLEIKFSPDYPSHAPPIYSIKKSQLRPDESAIMCSHFDQIYLDNLGSPVVHLWLEKAREILLEKVDSCCSAALEDSSVEKATDIAEQAISNDEVACKKSDEEEEYEEERGEGDGEEEEAYPTTFTSNFEPHSVSRTDSNDGVELPPIHHGEFVKDRKSTFQGHLAPVTDKRQVDMVMDKLKENKKIAEATHNIIAYRIDCKNGGFMTGNVDDGETHAAARMLHLLEIVDARNVLVVVTRWYGGIHLGPDRFKHINNCTRDLLDRHGYISEKTNSSKHSTKGGSDGAPAKTKAARKSKKH